jgi:hypothetical protein
LTITALWYPGFARDRRERAAVRAYPDGQRQPWKVVQWYPATRVGAREYRTVGYAERSLPPGNWLHPDYYDFVPEGQIAVRLVFRLDAGVGRSVDLDRVFLLDQTGQSVVAVLDTTPFQAVIAGNSNLSGGRFSETPCFPVFCEEARTSIVVNTGSETHCQTLPDCRRRRKNQRQQ